MERTASRPPPGGGANWVVFLAPLAVTGLVIVGAMIFVWVSDPEPVERPEVERVDLRELSAAPEASRLSSAGVPEESGLLRDHPGQKGEGSLGPRGLADGNSDQGFDEEGERANDEPPSVPQDGQETLSPQERVDLAFAEAHEKLNKLPDQMLKHVPILRHARGIIEERELRRSGALGDTIELTPTEVEAQPALEQAPPNDASSASEATEPESPSSMGAAGAESR